MWLILKILSGSLSNILIAVLISTLVVVGIVALVRMLSRSSSDSSLYALAFILWIFVSFQAILIGGACAVNRYIDNLKMETESLVQSAGVQAEQVDNQLHEAFNSVPYLDRVMSEAALEDVPVTQWPQTIADGLHQQVDRYIHRRWWWIAGGFGVVALLYLIMPGGQTAPAGPSRRRSESSRLGEVRSGRTRSASVRGRRR